MSLEGLYGLDLAEVDSLGTFDGSGLGSIAMLGAAKKKKLLPKVVFKKKKGVTEGSVARIVQARTKNLQTQLAQTRKQLAVCNAQRLQAIALAQKLGAQIKAAAAQVSAVKSKVSQSNAAVQTKLAMAAKTIASLQSENKKLKSAYNSAISQLSKAKVAVTTATVKSPVVVVARGEPDEQERAVATIKPNIQPSFQPTMPTEAVIEDEEGASEATEEDAPEQEEGSSFDEGDASETDEEGGTEGEEEGLDGVYDDIYGLP